MTRAERVVDAVTHSDRPVSISMRGTNQIVASSKSITLFFDDESYVFLSHSELRQEFAAYSTNSRKAHHGLRKEKA